jgi:hypothetical protein
MRRKVDILLIVSLVVVSLVYFLLEKKNPKALETSIPMAEESFFDQLQEIELKGSFKHQLFLEKVDSFWFWKDHTQKSQFANPQKAIDIFKSIELIEKIEASKVPAEFFKNAESYRFKDSSGKQIQFFVSNKKAVTGELYLKRIYGNKIDYFLVSETQEKKLRPKIVDWIGNKIFLDDFSGLEEIQTQNSNGSFQWKKAKENFVFFRNGVELLRANASTLEKQLAATPMFEAYPMGNFAPEELLSYGFSPEFKNNNKIQIIFSSGKTIDLYRSFHKDYSNFLVYPERSLMINGLESDLRILLGNPVGFLNLGEYHHLEINQIEKLVCHLKGSSKREHFYKDAFLHNQKNKSKLKDWTKQIYRIFPESIYFDSLPAVADLSLEIYDKGKSASTLNFYYLGDDLILHRKNKDYALELSQISKHYLKAISALCKGEFYE